MDNTGKGMEMREHVVLRDTPASPQGLPSLGEGLGAGNVADLSDIIADGEIPWKGGHFRSVISRPNLAATTQVLSFQNKFLVLS